MSRISLVAIVLGLVAVSGAAGFASVTHAQTTTAGYVDGLKTNANRAGYGNAIHGWAYDPYNTSASPQVNVTIDGKLATSASTGGARPDVDAALNIGANRGFTARIPDSYFDGKRHEVRLYMYNAASNRTIELQGSPIYFAAYDPGVKGTIDLIGSANSQSPEVFARGWAYDNSDNAASVSVVAYVDDYTTGKLVGADIADVARTDVDAAFHTGVYHGYAMPLDLSNYDSGEAIHISIYAVDLTHGELRLLNTMAHTIE